MEGPHPRALSGATLDAGALRILFTTTPGWGHIHPMVPLANAFVQRHDEVRWAAAADIAPRLEEAGFSVGQAGDGSEESLRAFNERFPEAAELPPPKRPDFFFPKFFGTVRTGAMLADLLPIVRDYRPDLIVSDQAELAGPIAAASIGVPCLCHSFGRLLPARRVEDAGREVAYLWEEQGLEPRPYAGCYDHLYLDIYPARLQSADSAHVSHTQPLRPVAFATGAEEALPDWVTGDSSDPLVYVTFGTVFNNPALIATVVEGLRELPVRVVVTLGPEGNPDDLGAQPNNVYVARYIPQTQLLPYCAAVVSHAGSGTFLAALSMGLPQLCLPQGADQFGNAAACEESGVGRVLQPGAITAQSVREEMEQILADTSYGAAAEGVKAEIKQMPSPAEAAEAIASRFASA